MRSQRASCTVEVHILPWKAGRPECKTPLAAAPDPHSTKTASFKSYHCTRAASPSGKHTTWVCLTKGNTLPSPRCYSAGTGTLCSSEPEEEDRSQKKTVPPLPTSQATEITVIAETLWQPPIMSRELKLHPSRRAEHKNVFLSAASYLDIWAQSVQSTAASHGFMVGETWDILTAVTLNIPSHA